VSHFLLVYDRRSGLLTRCERFAARNEAMSARFDAEANLVAGDDIEVVVLSAMSEDSLRHTHSRYFQSAGDLVLTGKAGQR
jgi:hypothetical protein